MRSEIAANLNVLEFVKIFGEICKTLGVRWSNRYGVTAPSWCDAAISVPICNDEFASSLNTLCSYVFSSITRHSISWHCHRDFKLMWWYWLGSSLMALWQGEMGINATDVIYVTWMTMLLVIMIMVQFGTDCYYTSRGYSIVSLSNIPRHSFVNVQLWGTDKYTL